LKNQPVTATVTLKKKQPVSSGKTTSHFEKINQPPLKDQPVALKNQPVTFEKSTSHL
jgi:hypothetical protein